MTRKTFFDLPAEYSDNESEVSILPVPFELTTSYGKGTANGPQAIFEASQQVELYDEELDDEPYMLGIRTLEPISVEGSAEDVLNRVEQATHSIVADGKFPILLGGEHSITPAAVRGVAKKLGDLTVIQLDAHADLRQEYEGTGLSHACSMARVREMFSAVQIGIRSMSKAEAEWIKRDELAVFLAKDLYEDDGWIETALAAIKTELVYITIDVDVFDASVIPETGTPEPGGLGWYQTLRFLRSLMNRKKAAGLDIMELAPQVGRHSSDYTIAKLLYKCIGYWKEGRES